MTEDNFDEPSKRNPHYNPDLGTPKDPRYQSFKEFKKTIDEFENSIKVIYPKNIKDKNPSENS